MNTVVGCQTGNEVGRAMALETKLSVVRLMIIEAVKGRAQCPMLNQEDLGCRG